MKIAKNTDFWFLNNLTLQYDSVRVENLLLTVPEDTIRIPAQGGEFVEGGIEALGGNFEWKILGNLPNWLQAQMNEDKDLLLVSVDLNEAEEKRNASLTIAHVDEIEYTKEIIVEQASNYYRLPDHDYMVIKYSWQDVNRDFDAAVAFEDTGVPEIDDLPLGEYLANPSGFLGRYFIYYNNRMLMQWGGDCRIGYGYETFCVYLSEINDPEKPIYDLLDRYVYINLYAMWFSNLNHLNHPVNIEIILYKGGTMKKIGYDFSNIKDDGQVGEPVFQIGLNDFIVDAWASKNNSDRVNSYYDYKGNFKNLAKVKYDKVKKTASLMRVAP